MPRANDSSATLDHTYVCDAWNRLVQVSEGSTTVAEYEYDAQRHRVASVASRLNRRIVKSLGTGTVKEHYYYNENWQELEVRQENSSTISANPREQFVWHPYYIDALVTRFYDSDVSSSTGVVQHYFTHDANYNVTAAVDTSGNVVERYDYSPYGEVIYLDGSFGSLSASTIAQARTYTGQRLDLSITTDTGLYHYRNRYYHAKLGRFISRDPIGYEGSQWSLYEYVGGRPKSETDPSGLLNKTGKYVVKRIAQKVCIKVVGACTPGVQIVVVGYTIYEIYTFCVWCASDPNPNPEPDPIPAPDPITLPEPCKKRQDKKNCSAASAYQLREALIFNEHEFKIHNGAIPPSRFDICDCKDGSIHIAAHGKCGKPGPVIEVDINWK